MNRPGSRGNVEDFRPANSAWLTTNQWRVAVFFLKQEGNLQLKQKLGGEWSDSVFRHRCIHAGCDRRRPEAPHPVYPEYLTASQTASGDHARLCDRERVGCRDFEGAVHPRQVEADRTPDRDRVDIRIQRELSVLHCPEHGHRRDRLTDRGRLEKRSEDSPAGLN
jgi:hypothetical protein